MTVDSTAFDFARQLRRPQVRAELKRLRFNGAAGDVVVLWLPGKTIDEATAVAADARRVLLVTRDEEATIGWTMRWAPCCAMHNQHCEPPGDLCCHACGEADHPAHPYGVSCVLDPEGTP